MNRLCKNCRNNTIIPDPKQIAEIAAETPIASALRALEDVYASRLKACSSCSGLREGVLCTWCGCYVQFRARVKESCCPNPSGSRWNFSG